MKPALQAAMSHSPVVSTHSTAESPSVAENTVLGHPSVSANCGSTSEILTASGSNLQQEQVAESALAEPAAAERPSDDQIIAQENQIRYTFWLAHF